MSLQKEGMDVDASTPIASTSSADVMKLIKDANHIILIQETEQWTIQGWPDKMAVFHKHDCRRCND
jgi:hypothetical protein